MKITLSFKTPDVLDQVSCDYPNATAEDMKFIQQFIEWDECCDIEFDTDAKTVKVLKQK